MGNLFRPRHDGGRRDVEEEEEEEDANGAERPGGGAEDESGERSDGALRRSRTGSIYYSAAMNHGRTCGGAGADQRVLCVCVCACAVLSPVGDPVGVLWCWKNWDVTAGSVPLASSNINTFPP